MKPLQWKEFFRCIRKTKSRFISMLLITALGVAFYVGIRASGPDMELSADAYYDETNLMDIRVLGTLGMTEDDVSAISQIDGISEAQGAYSADVFCTVESNEYVVSVFSLCDSINQMTIEEGRLPSSPDECFADTLFMHSCGLEIGDQITLHSGTDSSIDDTLHEDTYTIVGSGTYSWYLSWERGTTGIGDGNIDFFLAIPPESFAIEAYTVVYAATDSLDHLNSYSEEYERAVDSIIHEIESISAAQCTVRYQSVLNDAQQQISDAQKEIDDALKEIDDGRIELDDAKVQLDNANRDIADGERELIESQQELADAETELADGVRELGEGRKALIEGRVELAEQTALYYDMVAELEAGESELLNQIALLEAQEADVIAQKSYLEAQLAELTLQENQLTATKSSLEQQRSALIAQRDPLLAQKAKLQSQIDQLTAQKDALSSQLNEINQALSLFEQQARLQQTAEQLQALLPAKEASLESLNSERLPYDQEYDELHQQISLLYWQQDDLTRQKTLLDQQQDDIAKERNSISEAFSRIDSLHPSDWTTVSGYQNMLRRLSSLSDHTAADQAEKNILRSVCDAVAARGNDSDLTDELLLSVVPDAAASAIHSERQKLISAEADLNAQQTELSLSLQAWSESSALIADRISAIEPQYLQALEVVSSFDQAQQELSSEIAQMKTSLAEAEHGLLLIETQISQLNKTQSELLEAQAALEAAITEIDSFLHPLLGGMHEIESGLSSINSGLAQINSGLSEVDSYLAQIHAGKPMLEDGLSQVNVGLVQIEAAWLQIRDAQDVIDSGKNQLEEGEDQLYEARRLLADNQIELHNGLSELNTAKRQLRNGLSEFTKGRQELLDGKLELADKQSEYEQRLIDYEEAVSEAQPDLEDAQRKLDDARNDLAELKEPEWYVLDRSSIQTFVEYGMDADRITAIGDVFPVIFFLVAALVCLTGMTRMVEEERVQIGTFKALGYDKRMIAAKYFLYAFIASIIGSILGIAIGSSLLPAVIMGAYGILYSTLTSILTPIHWPLSASAVLIAVACTVIAAMAACLRTLRDTPANLMRPSAPPKGKRVFLEYIRPLWRMMSFAQKAAARNLFRYKKRLFMTIFGIAGCMALLVVGFGLRDSINKIVTTQYSAVWTYDASLTSDAEHLNDVRSELTGSDIGIVDSLAVHQTAIDAESPDRTVETYLFVPESTESIDTFVQLHDRVTRETYELNDDSVIITEKLATLLGISAGDSLTLSPGETERYEVKVHAVVENYLNHYVYMTPDFYKSTFGESADFTQLFFHTPSMNEAESLLFSERLLAIDNVKSVSLVSDLQNHVAEMMDAMNLVIWVLIIAAGLLAFVVLFNLNSISILERRRELATLRVLGFYDGELAAYLYRENVVLTFIGIAAGVGLGILLHGFVITTCEIDMIMFGRVIQPVSYLLSVLMTLFFAGLVNFGMFFTLRKIDMVESLKSVE